MDPIYNHWEYSRTKTDRQFFENIKCKYTIMINKYLIIGSIFALIKIVEIKLDMGIWRLSDMYYNLVILI